MTDVQIGAVFTGLVLVIGALAAAVALLWRTKGNQTRRDSRTAASQWREVSNGQQRQIERQDALIHEINEALEELIAEHTDCQLDLADLYGQTKNIHDHVIRLTRCCLELGGDPGEPPTMPPRPKRPDRAASEFKKRTLEQKKQNVQQLSGTISPPPEGK